jgi:hypothetical protein
LLFVAISLHSTELFTENLFRVRAANVLISMLWACLASFGMLIPPGLSKLSGGYEVVVAMGGFGLVVPGFVSTWIDPRVNRRRGVAGFAIFVVCIMAGMLIALGRLQLLATTVIAGCVAVGIVGATWQGWDLVVHEGRGGSRT